MSMKFKSVRLFASVAIGFLMIGCGDSERNRDTDRARAATGTADTALPSSTSSGADLRQPTATSSLRTILFVGTSLTAGQGVAETQAFPHLVQQRVDEASLGFHVVNAGVSGETSAGALRRVDWLLQQEFDILVLETGANDMLRGVDPADTERNIQQIIDRVRQRRPTARIILAGMLALPNLGPDYGRRFGEIYPRLAERNGVVLLPFLLDGVATVRHLNQTDGIHPNAAGQEIIAETVWNVLEPVLRATPG